MKENKVQTRFERMVELNEEIGELKSFIRSNNHLFEMNKYHQNLHTISMDIPKCLNSELLESAKQKLVELQKEFDELNQF